MASKKTASGAPVTTAQSLSSLIKSARDIMRKDKGLSGDLDRLPLLTWIMFLKFMDDLESQREEEAALAGRSENTRVLLLRLGMVITKGGALDRMLLPFKLGAGGPIGSGRQFWPWIAMEDVIGAIHFALENEALKGPMNLVSPQETRCHDFTSTLGKVLRRPSFLPLPAFAARLLLGEMAEGLLLASARVQPRALEEAGYEFRSPSLEDALNAALDR